jgi:hypothetical protein
MHRCALQDTRITPFRTACLTLGAGAVTGVLGIVRKLVPLYSLGAQAVAGPISAWGRNPLPVPFPRRRREYIRVASNAAWPRPASRPLCGLTFSLPHTLPEKAPRPGLLSAVAPRGHSNIRIQSHVCFGTKRLRTGSGEFFLDRRQQGGDCSRQSFRISSLPGGRSWRGAYTDVLAACPERIHRSLAPARMQQQDG